jgi:Ca2+-binding EF-hand superfamily protein
MSAVDEELFRLLDTRGIGSVTLDQVQDFALHVKKRMSAADVAQIFSLLQDKRGNVDRSTFPRLLRGIESGSRQTGNELLELHLTSLYHELFNLVDEDGGGTLSRSEVRPLLDTIIQVFGVKTITDVGIVFRSVGVGMNDEILFPQFRSIVSRIVGSHPISHVIHAFRDAQTKKKIAHDRGARLRALTCVLNSTTGGATTAEPSVHGSSLDDKDNMIRQLEERIKELERGDRARRNSTRSRGHPLAEADDEDDDGGSRGDVPMRPITVSQSTLVAFELDGDASAADIGTLGRLAVQAACTDALFRTILDASTWSRDSSSYGQLVEAVNRSQQRVAVSMQAMLNQVRDGLVKTLAPEDRDAACSSEDESEGEGAREETGSKYFSRDDDALCIFQTAFQGFSKTTAHVNELQQHRESLAMAAAATAHLSAHRKKISLAVMEHQQASCAFISTALALRSYLSDVEGAFLRAQDNASAPPVSRECRLSFMARNSELRSTFSAVFTAMSATVTLVNESLASHYTKTKDRACQANLSLTSSGPLPTHADCASPSPRSALFERHRSGSPSRSPLSVSRPPRSRARRTMERRGPERVDALVADHLIQRGVAVPPNFGRVVEGRGPASEGAAATMPSNLSAIPSHGTAGPRSFYSFGIKKIELSALDDHTLCVHVGGGFLLFEEYCKAHTEFETIKWLRHGSAASGGTRSSYGYESRGPSVSHQVQQRAVSPTAATRSLFS